MVDRPNSSAASRERFRNAAKKIILEAALVAIVGASLAFAANAISPRGLNLARDNFPARPSVSSLWSAADQPNLAHSDLAQRLAAEGLGLAHSNDVVQLFHDPRCEQGLLVFVDARGDEAYQGGHIPGAYQFDRYYPDKFVGTILPACSPAEKIVVYCHGGNCEDSEFAAVMLSEWGIGKDKLLVYGGGITEWSSNHWPVEVGVRRSGNLLQ